MALFLFTFKRTIILEYFSRCNLFENNQLYLKKKALSTSTNRTYGQIRLAKQKTLIFVFVFVVLLMSGEIRIECSALRHTEMYRVPCTKTNWPMFRANASLIPDAL